MNLVNSIANMAMDMNAARFQQDVNLTMMKKTMDTTATQAQGIIEMMDAVPHFAGAKGSLLDVRA